MEPTTTTIITAILGLVWTGLGLAFVFNPKPAYEGLEDFHASPGRMMLTGILTMILGAMVMVFHMRWSSDWEVVISLLGIATFLKGLFYVGLPHHMRDVKKRMIKSPQGVRGWGLLTIVIGLALLYLSVL